jgi:hypothetical protein
MLRIHSSKNFVVDAPKIIAVFALKTEATVQFDSKSARVPPQSLAWASVPAGTRVEVVSENALWMEIPL